MFQPELFVRKMARRKRKESLSGRARSESSEEPLVSAAPIILVSLYLLFSILSQHLFQARLCSLPGASTLGSTLLSVLSLSYMSKHLLRRVSKVIEHLIKHLVTSVLDSYYVAQGLRVLSRG